MKKILLVAVLLIGAVLLSSCNFQGLWELSFNGQPVARAQVEDLREVTEDVEETVVEEPAVVTDEAVVEEPVATDVIEEILSIDHMTWSISGETSFIVTDGNVTEVGSDLFTDPTKGNLAVTITPSEPTCLLQFGEEIIFSEPFEASFEEGDVNAGFRVIALSYWEDLPLSDGAFFYCWEREIDEEVISIPLWEIFGETSFIVTDGDVTESGSDLFTNPSKGNLTVTITPSEPTCLLQFGKTEIFSVPFEVSFIEGDMQAGFRVISFSYWKNLSTNDGAFYLCWPRP